MRPKCRLWILVLLLMSGSHGFAASTQQQTFDDLIKAATVARDAKQYSRTLNLLKKAYDLKPLPTLLNNMGRIYELLGRYREAMKAYDKVANDPNADVNLRAIDAARSSKLQGKLGKAYLRISDVQKGARVFINGDKAIHIDTEMVVKPGKTVIIMRAVGAKASVLTTVLCPIDRRTDVTFAQLIGPGTRGSLLLPPKPFAQLSIDGMVIPAMMIRPNRILLPAGRHLLEIVVDKKAPLRFTVVVESGVSHDIRDHVRGSLLARKNIGMKTPNKGKNSVGPYITVATGGLMAAVGGVFLFLADVDRVRVDAAATDANGVVTGLTLSEARELESRANTRSTIGGTMVGIGGSAVISGVVWFLIDRARLRKKKGLTKGAVVLVPSGQGIALQF
jgi:hypothetical protein